MFGTDNLKAGYVSPVTTLNLSSNTVHNTNSSSFSLWSPNLSLLFHMLLVKSVGLYLHHCFHVNRSRNLFAWVISKPLDFYSTIQNFFGCSGSICPNSAHIVFLELTILSIATDILSLSWILFLTFFFLSCALFLNLEVLPIAKVPGSRMPSDRKQACIAFEMDDCSCLQIVSLSSFLF